MKIKFIYLLVSFLGLANVGLGQNDFSIVWNTHATGDTVEENPFNGGFTIKNVGEFTIPIGDTLWYGYFIDGEKYDLALNLDLVSGEVLDEPFEPETEIFVYNSFAWPLWEPGLSVEMCAVVYGIGFESHTGELYTGDDNPDNNTACIMAIVPDYTTGILPENEMNSYNFSIQNKQIVLNNAVEGNNSTAFFTLYSLTGELLESEVFKLESGNTIFPINDIVPGLFIAELYVNGSTYRQKIVLP